MLQVCVGRAGWRNFGARHDVFCSTAWLHLGGQTSVVVPLDRKCIFIACLPVEGPRRWKEGSSVVKTLRPSPAGKNELF